MLNSRELVKIKVLVTENPVVFAERNVRFGLTQMKTLGI